MATPLAEVYLRTTATDSTGLISSTENVPLRFAVGVGSAPIDTQLVCPAGVFTAATVPAGARAVRIQVGAQPSLVLKGVTGDVGLPITPALNQIGSDQWLTLAPGATFGFLNNGANSATLRIVFY